MLGPILIFLICLAVLPGETGADFPRKAPNKLRCETKYGFTKLAHVQHATATATLTIYDTTTRTIAAQLVLETPKPAEQWVTRTFRTTTLIYVGNPQPHTITQTKNVYSVYTPPPSTTIITRTSTVLPAFHAVADGLSQSHTKREPLPVLAPRHDTPGIREDAFAHFRLYPTAVRCTALARVYHTRTSTHRMPPDTVTLKQITNTRTAIRTEVVRVVRTRLPKTVIEKVTTTHVSTRKAKTVTSTHMATATSWSNVSDRAAKACANPHNFYGENSREDNAVYIDAVDVSNGVGTADQTAADCCVSCVHSPRCAGSFFRLDNNSTQQCFHVFADKCNPSTGQQSRRMEANSTSEESCGCSSGIVVSNGYCGLWNVVYET